MIEPRKMIIPNKAWAQAFLELREASDESALQCLSDEMENHFNRDERITYLAIRRFVDSLLELNTVIIEMEIGEIEFNSEIEECYRKMMLELELICRESINCEELH